MAPLKIQIFSHFGEKITGLEWREAEWMMKELKF